MFGERESLCELRYFVVDLHQHRRLVLDYQRLGGRYHGRRHIVGSLHSVAWPHSGNFVHFGSMDRMRARGEQTRAVELAREQVERIRVGS